MSGGGVTPFSPTPWKFDTGTTPQTMGLNCVAGTTEYDEDKGIGLVLYTNSEGQLIVWKMSDGTKQGTVVPLTTEYQSMLKSEFENKTGITISYIIIHPYTEETINVESSITINSGDTPEPLTPFIKIPTNQPPTVYVGKIVPYQNNEYQILIYGNNTTDKVGIFNDTGVFVDDTQQVTSELESYIKQTANEKSGVVVTGFDVIQSPVNLYQTLPDWDKYK